MGGTSAKESFFANQGSVEPTLLKVDSIDRTRMIIKGIPDPLLGITLSHDPEQLFALFRIFFHELCREMCT